MLKRQLTITLFMFLALCLPVARAQNKSTIALTDAERGEVSQAAASLKAANAALDQAVKATLEAELECESAVASISRIHTAFARVETARARAEVLREKLRRVHNCAECDFTDDLKGLEVPKRGQP